jgi:hypothetical protein
VLVNATGVVVLYGEPGYVQTGATGAVVLYEESPAVQANAVGVIGVYSETLPSRRVFPVPPFERQLQSQIGKRKFPVVS